MFKKILLLTAITSISACSSFNQCQSDKNYVISNPEAIEEYKKIVSENKIRSIYYIIKPTENCNWDSCVNFDTQKFDFIEKNFDDQNRKGVYRIYASKDLTRSDCLAHNPAYTGLDSLCFYTVKNENGVIYSNYISENTDNNEVYKSSFYDREKKRFLFEVSSQTYSSHALIGTSSSGFCKTKIDNNPDYKFKISRLVN